MMIVNYHYGASTLTNRVEVTNIETFVRETRKFLKEVTPIGSKCCACITFEGCPDEFAISKEEGKWYYSKDGWDMPYAKFKDALGKTLSIAQIN